MRNMLGLAVIFVLAVTAAQARPSLRDVPKVENGLFSMAVADEIRNNCTDISARMLKALSELKSLERYARELGYTKDEIKAYIRSDAEKNRMRAKRDAYLHTQGVVKTDPATYCAAGRAEIKNSSQIGALLKAR